MGASDLEGPWSGLADLVVDDRAASRFRVSRRVFTEDAILALERERIFQRCWLFVAHVSELPRPHAFVTREVAGKMILLTRDADGRLHAFQNTCTHRGVAVCREPAGVQKFFGCPYHGWVFDTKGALVDMPGRDAVPPEATEGGALDLVPVPRLDEFRGFLFVCFDASAEPLVDYLAGAADYLAYVADQGLQGMEVVGGTQQYSAKANWKMLSENSHDGYHGLSTHSTYFDYLRSRDSKEHKRKMGAHGWVKDLGNGHAVGESVGAAAWGRPSGRWVPGYGEDAKPEVEAIAAEIHARLGEERARIVVNGDRNLVIFPNLVVNDIMAVTIRTYWPTGAGRMKVNSWALAPVGESASSRDRRLKSFVEFLGPAGFATPDDVEMLESAQRAYESFPEMFNDCSRGMRMATPSKTEELQQRTFWRRWSQQMRNAPRSELTGP